MTVSSNNLFRVEPQNGSGHFVIHSPIFVMTKLVFIVQPPTHYSPIGITRTREAISDSDFYRFRNSTHGYSTISSTSNGVCWTSVTRYATTIHYGAKSGPPPGKMNRP